MKILEPTAQAELIVWVEPDPNGLVIVVQVLPLGGGVVVELLEGLVLFFVQDAQPSNTIVTRTILFMVM